MEKRLRRHGLTLEQYNALVEQQRGRCGLCFADNGHRPLYVDHDHESGSVRGLLCHTCNTNLGGYEAMKKNARVDEYLLAAQCR